MIQNLLEDQLINAIYQKDHYQTSAIQENDKLPNFVQHNLNLFQIQLGPTVYYLVSLEEGSFVNLKIKISRKVGFYLVNQQENIPV